MLSKLKRIFQFILSFLLLAGVVYLIYLGLTFLVKHLEDVDPKIIVAGIAGIITVSGYFITKYLERKQKVEQEIRDKKIPIYEEFIEFFFMILNQNRTGNISDKKMEEFIMKFNQKAIIWLSDESLSAYVSWRKKAINASKSKEENIASILEFEKLLLSFRKDIGHDNKDLKEGVLLSVFVNDLDKYISNEK